MGQNFTKWHVGRFQLSLLEDFGMLGRSQSIYEVEVGTISLDDISANELWRKRLGAITKLLDEADFESAAVTNEDFGPNTSSVSYTVNETFSDHSTYEVQKEFSDHVLRASFEGLTSKSDNIRKLLNVVLDAYRNSVLPGFSVGHGTLVSEPSVNELVEVWLRDPQRNIDVRIETSTVASNSILESPKQRTTYAKPRLPEVEFKELKDKGKKIGDLDGQEYNVAVEFEQGNRHRYTWWYPGIEGDTMKPEIEIVAEVSEESVDGFQDEWMAVLKSFKLRR